MKILLAFHSAIPEYGMSMTTRVVQLDEFEAKYKHNFELYLQQWFRVTDYIWAAIEVFDISSPSGCSL